MVRRFRERWLGQFAHGQLQPLIDRTFPLAQAADAHRRMESGQATGKIVLTMLEAQS